MTTRRARATGYSRSDRVDRAGAPPGRRAGAGLSLGRRGGAGPESGRRATSGATLGRAGEVVRGLLALAVVLVLVVGVPVGLVVLVGWPLPAVMPSSQAVVDALTRVGVSDRTIVKIVACVLWLAWLELTFSVLAEAVAVARRRQRRPGTFGPFNRFAASLVTAITLLTASTHLAGAAPVVRPVAAVASPRAPVAATIATRSGTGPLLVSPPVAYRASSAVAVISAPPPAAATGPSWTVRRRDTLWGIAERTLGAGPRWAEIRALNVGREVAPGVTFTSDTEVLIPGWVLALPADASAAGPSVPATAPSTVEVEPGDTLIRIAERVYGDGSRWRELWDANQGRQMGARRFVDPNVILVGWELDVPGGSSPAPPTAAPSTVPLSPSPPAIPTATPDEPTSVAAPPVPDTPAPPAAPAVSDGPVAAIAPAVADPSPPSDRGAPVPSAPDRPESRPDLTRGPSLPVAAVEDVGVPELTPATVARPPWVLPAGIVGAALLATGTAGLLASRHRRRLRTMTAREALPGVDLALSPTSAAVRLGEDPIGMARVDVALRYLAAQLGADAEGLPRPEIVLRFADGTIEVLFDRDVEPPARWRPGAPRRLALPADIPIEALVTGAGRVPSPCPALVLLGTTDEAELYADLEALGTVVVEGPADAATAVARALVATLAVSPLADLIHVVTAGVDCFGFANEERVQPVSDPDAALDLTAALSAGVRHALGDGGTHDLRRRSPEEPWEPVVAILLRADLTPEQRADVQRLVASGGVAVVTDADLPGARYRLRSTGDGQWQLDPLGMSVRSQGLAATELANLGALLAEAKATPLPAPPADDVRTEEPFVEPPWELLVRLIGPVEVVNRRGDIAEFERAKALELVAWLAQHRERPTRTGARTAMWETDVRDATFANVVSDARRSLTAIAPPAEGREWLARTYGEQLPLDSLVLADADLLGARLQHARGQTDQAAIETLRQGLELVQDPPYTGTAWLWPDGEGLPSHLTLLATNAATAMAERCLAIGDTDGVFWATGRGLRVLPGHDELVCLRMCAHAAAGNLAGIRKEFESYERVVMADAWGDGSLSPKVVRLRNRLLAPTRTGAAGAPAVRLADQL